MPTTAAAAPPPVVDVRTDPVRVIGRLAANGSNSGIKICEFGIKGENHRSNGVNKF